MKNHITLWVDTILPVYIKGVWSIRKRISFVTIKKPKLTFGTLYQRHVSLLFSFEAIMNCLFVKVKHPWEFFPAIILSEYAFDLATDHHIHYTEIRFSVRLYRELTQYCVKFTINFLRSKLLSLQYNEFLRRNIHICLYPSFNTIYSIVHMSLPLPPSKINFKLKYPDLFTATV